MVADRWHFTLIALLLSLVGNASSAQDLATIPPLEVSAMVERIVRLCAPPVAARRACLDDYLDPYKGELQHHLYLEALDRLQYMDKVAAGQAAKAEEEAQERAIQREINKTTALLRKIERERAALAKLPPPRIGMTFAEVMKTNWGPPARVSRTITADGRIELWHYGIGRYLSFDRSGRLEIIQE